MKKIPAIAVALVLVSACTPRPDSISPVSQTGAFDNMSCERAVAELETERRSLDSMEKSQNAAATADAIGVFLILVPVSKVTGGDRAGDIGASKGKIMALEQRVSKCDSGYPQY